MTKFVTGIKNYRFTQIVLSAAGFVLLMLLTNVATAQESVEINGQDVGSWFERNWMWVAGAVLLLLILLIAAASKRKAAGVRKTTTVVKDTYGNVKSVTTTEEKP
jgi:multisubunit Na+/H+ antiporter MnhB subunit